ncbi:MAG: DUF4082 domain-containing protein [Microlunatus sp.]
MPGRPSTTATGKTSTISQRRRGIVFAVFLALVGALLVTSPPPQAQAACTGNAIVCENELPGSPESEWDIDGVGDESIQGFATQISVNAGSAVQFKVDTDAHAYTIKIYRLGWYQGNGARLVDTISPSASLPQNQPACATDAATEIYDCGTWGVSASWNVPTTAVSGVYIARLIRSDTNGDSHIPFIVRNDGNTSKVLFQTSDTTWQAYNTYGGSNFYWGGDNGRAYKLSYNRPFSTRALEHGRDFLFSNEYPMIRFLEQNGMDVSYVSGLDTSVDANLIKKHEVFLSVGHDEYWSKEQRDNVLAARDAGVSLGFFGGNNMYWKTRWEPSQDGASTANRTLVCYKDTWANTRIDPVAATATWRDPRFGDLGHGPENELMGTLYKANSVDLAIKVNSSEGKLRLWRNTSLASQSDGSTASLAAHTVGYESDEDLDNGYRPAGLARMSTTTGPTSEFLTDFGNTVVAGTTTHHVTQYRAASGALVFSTGSIQWAWGLDTHHDGADIQPADPRIRQATLNVLADLGAEATTRASDLVAATKSTDTTAPTSTITSPSASSIAAGSLVTVEGTASDVGGRVAAVEVSVDGGATFHPAEGRESFTYTDVLTGTGPGAIQVRAVDDSGNIQSTTTKLAVTTDCPCTIFGATTPTTPSVADTTALTVGTKFKPEQDGYITGIRFYKGAANTGAHTGTLYTASGEALAQVNFTNETASGWQTATFSSAVPVTAGTTYVAAYYAPNGGIASDSYFFSYRGYTSGKLTALGGNDNPNGVFSYNNQFPVESFKQTNYYVDAVWSATDTTPLSVTSTSPVGGATSVPNEAKIKAVFSRAITGGSANFVVLDSDNVAVPGDTSYDSASKTASFTPNQALAANTTYTVTVTADPVSGAGLAAPMQWSFTSAKAPAAAGVCPCTLFDDSDGPTNAPESETSKVQLGVAFRSNTAGTISAIRFYKAAANTGTHTVTLWSAAGSQLATATATNESTEGWQEVAFDSPIAINADTTYIASYTAPNGRYSAKAGGLSAAITRSPLSTVANGGRYTYGTGAPLSAAGANYFVDPVFALDPGQAPEVSSTSPGKNASSVPVGAQFTASFNTSVQPGSATVSIKKSSDGTVVPGNLANETAGSSVTFTPSSPLEPSTEYSVTVKDAKSSGGTAMTGDYTAKFTTSGAEACPCSLMETTTQPVISDSEDGGATTLGLKFKATVDGSIKGLRYYRDEANTGTHKGTLWDADGDVLATVTFDNSGSGWQIANFSSPVDVDAGTTYVAGYYAPNGHYSAASGYFNDPVVNTPLASVGTGGVYADGDKFPNQSYLNTNYYVDVIFTTDNTAPPKVTGISPAADATNAAVGTKVKATFNRAITASTLSMTVKKSDDQTSVSGQVSYDSGDKQATFEPATELAPSTKYTVTVSATSTSGTAMTSPKTWDFTTKAAAPSGQEVSLFTTSDTPAVPAWDDSDAVTVGVKFSSSVAGQVTGVRFYAGTGNTGGQTVNLWNAAGDSLATGTASGSGVGWRTVEFDEPVSITAGQTYTVSYLASTGHYSVTSGAFSDEYTKGPLTVPTGGAVYKYGAGFPASGTSANYWVDVILVVPN